MFCVITLALGLQSKSWQDKASYTRIKYSGGMNQMEWKTLAYKVRTMWEPRGKTFKIPSWILIWDLKIENWDFQSTSNSLEYLKIEDWLIHSIPIL
jgi:hypothetical protein